MGTRNLTMVIKDQETKVAQYGQWDGYPEGQGLTILSFLRKPSNIEKLKEVLPKIRFENEKDIEDKYEYFKSIGIKDGWVNLEQSEQINKQYPFNNRDHGAEILSKLLEQSEQSEIVLVNSEEFATDSLFCEWAYVVDLDKNTLEVYKGINQSIITKDDRFFSLNDKESEYRPIRIVQSFSLDKLPDPEKFLLECRKEHDKGRIFEKSEDNDLER